MLIEPNSQRTFRVAGVYALADALEPRLVRYVGSSHDVEHRFYQHLRDARRGSGGTSAAAWLRRMQRDDIAISCTLLEVGDWPDGGARSEHEALWISRFSEPSLHLLNRNLRTNTTLTTSSEGGKAPKSLIFKHSYFLTTFIDGRIGREEEAGQTRGKRWQGWKGGKA